MSRKLVVRALLAVALLILLIRFFTEEQQAAVIHLEGQTMGTIGYNVKYIDQDNNDYKKKIDSILVVLNESLSTYIKYSEISILNSTSSISKPSQMFLDVLQRSQDVWTDTYGAFDPTVGPLVNAWGFGPDGRPNILDSVKVDSLIQYVGFGKMLFDSKKIAMEKGMYLDFSAIAKGYAVDLVAEFLEFEDITDYMVEIGGEVRVKGANGQGNLWKIGIEDPTVNVDEQKLLAIAELSDLAMATSGNYRNYYEKDGKIIAHTIDPRTGFTAQNSVLSASVFAEDCMTADAYATAMMVLGLEASKAVIEHNDIEAVILYSEGKKISAFVSQKMNSSVEFLKEIRVSSLVQ